VLTTAERLEGTVRLLLDGGGTSLAFGWACVAQFDLPRVTADCMAVKRNIALHGPTAPERLNYSACAVGGPSGCGPWQEIGMCVV